jgi:hypothetical protein
MSLLNFQSIQYFVYIFIPIRFLYEVIYKTVIYKSKMNEVHKLSSHRNVLMVKEK